MTATGWMSMPATWCVASSARRAGATSPAVRLLEKPAQSVKQERSRTAGGIEHLLFKRRARSRGGHLRRQPVWRVIFAEAVSLLPIDERFVERLHHVALDFRQAETPDMRHDAADQVRSLRVSDDPVEEIALYCPVDTRGCKRLA